MSKEARKLILLWYIDALQTSLSSIHIWQPSKWWRLPSLGNQKRTTCNVWFSSLECWALSSSQCFDVALVDIWKGIQPVKTYKPIIISRESLLGKTIPTRSWAIEKKDGQIKISSSHHSSITRTAVARHTSQTRYLQELQSAAALCCASRQML